MKNNMLWVKVAALIAAIIVISVLSTAIYCHTAATNLYLAATHEQEEGRLLEAQRGYEQALGYNPWHADAAYQLATIFRDRHNPEEALRLMKRAVSLNRHNADYYLGLGYLYLHQFKDKKSAEINFKKAYKENSKNYYACIILGQLAEEKSQPKTAISFYETAIDSEPKLILAYKRMAELYGKEGMAPLAQKYWDDVREINPRDKDARAHLSMGRVAR
ncbi:MAG TPA: tetratricopeptide repeat protein [Candidatus Aquicultor sp.]|jgi:tetratricopeptide (TPR) repeat protein